MFFDGAFPPQVAGDALGSETDMSSPQSLVLCKTRMMSLGFPSEWADVSLQRCNGHFESAVLYCYEHGSVMDALVEEERQRNQRLLGGMGENGKKYFHSPTSSPSSSATKEGGGSGGVGDYSANGDIQGKAKGNGNSTPMSPSSVQIEMNPSSNSSTKTQGPNATKKHKHAGVPNMHYHLPAPSPSTNGAKDLASENASETELTRSGEILKSLTSIIMSLKDNQTLILTSMWAMWLFFGSMFYGFRNGYQPGQAFYMAVNVGYSIGWGYPADPDDESKWFSVVYLLMGSSAISAALGMFANSIVADNDSWYEDALQLVEFKKHQAESPFFARKWAWIVFNWDKLKGIFVWFIFVLLGTFGSMGIVGWSFTDSFYFAVSSMSTGGLWALPPESEDWKYGLVGFYAAVGCPLMGLAMATAASFFIQTEDPEETTAKILQPVTQEEIDMMGKFGLENGDGQVDQAEYIILCMVRIGAVAPPLVEEVIQRFKALDHSGDGTLSYEELMQNHDKQGHIIDQNGAIINHA